MQLKHAMAAAAFAGLIVGSGAAAWAQTDGSSSSSSDSPSSDGSAPAPAPAPGAPGFHHHHGGDPANCPNMGPNDGSSSNSNNVPGAYSGA